MDDETFTVPRGRIAATHAAMQSELLAAIEPLLFGPPARGYEARAALETQLATITDKRFACAVHSATIGLLLALRACGLAPGDEVITVGNSDISTTAAIRQCGATPVLCDVRLDDYTIDGELVERLITPRTRALLPVDLYGHPADVNGLREIAGRYNLRIVEDAALALGASDFGLPMGAFADLAVFSFAPFKPLGSAGNGGMVVTDDPLLAEQVRLLASYGHTLDRPAGQHPEQHYVAEGYNVPLDPLQAAILLVKLPSLQEWTARRRAIAARYMVGLRGLGVGLPAFRATANPTFRCFTIRVPAQHNMYRRLRNAGVEAVLHYTPPIYRHPVYGGALPGSRALPMTDQLAGELICLPVAPGLSDSEVAYVVETVRDCLDRGDGESRGAGEQGSNPKSPVPIIQRRICNVDDSDTC